MNPFRYGEVVTGKDFCDRPELVRQLRQCLSSGRNTAIVGERRTGKTSLIHETARRIRGLRLVHAQLWAVKSIDDVAQRLIDAMVSTQQRRSSVVESVARALGSLRPRIDVDPYTGQPSVTLSQTERLTPRGLQAVFDLIEDMSRRHRHAVLLDEFQDIRLVEDADALLGVIRDRIQRQREVSYVFAGSIRHAMERVFRDPGSPFFKSLSVIEVESIDREQYIAFLNGRFRAGRRRVPDESYATIFSLAEENPSDVQQLCAAIWDRSEAGETIGSPRLQQAVERIFATERKGYEALVRPLTDIQMRCLRGLARLGGDEPQSKRFLEETGIRLAATVKRALNRLVALELVYDRDTNYKFFDPFFRQWILARFG
jgi:uncharacterized protein